MHQCGLADTQSHAPATALREHAGKRLLMHATNEADARRVAEQARHEAGAGIGGLLV